MQVAARVSRCSRIKVSSRVATISGRPTSHPTLVLHFQFFRQNEYYVQ